MGIVCCMSSITIKRAETNHTNKCLSVSAYVTATACAVQADSAEQNAVPVPDAAAKREKKDKAPKASKQKDTKGAAAVDADADENQDDWTKLDIRVGRISKVCLSLCAAATVQ